MSYIEGKRIIWIDYARVFAIICVVICHAAETYYRPILLGQAQTGFIQWFLLNFLFMAGRLGVPLFMGITGVLMLGKEWEPFSFYKKYKENFHKLLESLLNSHNILIETTFFQPQV